MRFTDLRKKHQCVNRRLFFTPSDAGQHLDSAAKRGSSSSTRNSTGGGEELTGDPVIADSEAVPGVGAGEATDVEAPEGVEDGESNWLVVCWVVLVLASLFLLLLSPVLLLFLPLPLPLPLLLLLFLAVVVAALALMWVVPAGGAGDDLMVEAVPVF